MKPRSLCVAAGAGPSETRRKNRGLSLMYIKFNVRINMRPACGPGGRMREYQILEE